jgi:hypothetical protein
VFDARIFSSCCACFIVAANELPSGKRRSTSSSGRDDAGKNCCGTARNIASEPAKIAIVAAITISR